MQKIICKTHTTSKVLKKPSRKTKILSSDWLMSEYFLKSAREQVKNSMIFESWLKHENQYDSEYQKLFWVAD